MCYHVSVKSNIKILEERFNASYQSEKEIKTYYHVSGFSHPILPVIRCDFPEFIKPCYWGLIPSWVKDEEHAKKMMDMTLNAKCETVFTLPSFRNSIRNRRCLVLVDGFFEWRTLSNKKYPYFIYLKKKEPFAMGGIYSDWINKETGEIVQTFSILTTPANLLLQKIHNVKLRMPLIISKENEKKWLQTELNENQINQMMQPFDDSKLMAHTISKLITSKTEDSNQEAVQQPHNYPEIND